MDKVDIVKAGIEFYKTKITEYSNGNIDPNIKGIRAAMGVYAERETEKYMTRIKTPAGILTVEQFQVISAIADKYSHGNLHFTSRQDIQFHKVELENTAKIMEEAFEIGIDTFGAGGNSARNVACSPLSGVDRNEVFDVTQYAVAVSKHFLKDPTITKLPRKYKVAFSNNDFDTAGATISDLGFIAKIQDGKKGFEVYGAGGLGGASRVSLKLEEFIPEEDVLYYAQAMKELFEAEGDRQNRNKARIRHIVNRLGEEAFKDLFKQYVKQVKEEKQLFLQTQVLQSQEQEINAYEYSELELKKYSDYIASLDTPLIIPQKQIGQYSIYIHPKNGNLSTVDLNKILKYLKALNYDVSIRLTNSQGFYVRDVKGADVEGLMEGIAGFTSGIPVENSVSCVGYTVCGIGLCNSQGLLRAIYERFEHVNVEIKKLLPVIHLSGCFNSCGRHQIGKLGLSGKSVKTLDGNIPYYGIFFGGVIEANKAKLGEVKGNLPAKKIPEFLYKLSTLAYELEYKTFDEFLEREEDEVENLIREFEGTESFEINPQLYYDYNSDRKFLENK